MGTSHSSHHSVAHDPQGTASKDEIQAQAPTPPVPAPAPVPAPVTVTVKDGGATVAVELTAVAEEGKEATEPEAKAATDPPVEVAGHSADQTRITGERLQQLLEKSHDQHALLRRIEVLVRAKGLWGELETLLEDSEPLPEALVTGAEAKMAVEKDDKRDFFLKLQNAVTGGQGLDALPRCSVHVSGLTLSSTKCRTSKKSGSGPPTVGTFLYSLATLPFAVARQQKETKVLLDDVSCVFKPGATTLLLGPPGAGKTMLLKAIARKLRGSHLETSGKVYYSGKLPEETGVLISKLVSYVSQIDSHIPALTVEETFQFANDCITGKDPGAIFAKITDRDAVERFIEAVGTPVQLIARFLGLERVKDTIVGNDMMRGVSGGQKRRVTSGEIFCGVALVLCADSISTGLDSATTYDLVRMLKEAGEAFQYTQIISLLQPAPEVVDLFDNIMLLDEGKVIFHGSKARAIEHFRSLGFHCPERKDFADFLQEVTTKQGRVYIQDPGSLATPPPRTPAEFHERWKQTPEYAAIQAELEQLAAGKSDEPADFPDILTKEFVGSWLQSFQLCFQREWLLINRDPQKSVVRIVQAIVLGAVNALLFTELGLFDLTSKLGLLFQCLTFLATTAFGDLPSMFEERAVFYKQRDASYFPTTAYLAARAIAAMPVQIAETLLFSTIVYFSADLTSRNGGEHFFFFVLLSILLNFTMGQFFSLLTALLPDLSAGMNVGSLSFLLFILFSGYIVALEDIPDGWLWMYYLSPMSWAYLSFVQNEFKSARYDVDVANNRKDLGDLFLDQQGIPQDGSLQFLSLALVVAFFFGYFAVAAWGFHNVRFVSAGQGAELEEDPDEEAVQDEGANRLVEQHKSESRLRLDLEAQAPRTPGSVRTKAKRKAGGAALGFTPATLAWVDLSYSVDLKTRDDRGEPERLELLHEITGYAVPGKCVALMGSSGAGKTTLLDVLAHRKTSGHVTGKILVNGQELDRQSFSRVCGYCEQFDSHSPCSTVVECMEFSASLRLPADTSPEERAGIVKEMLQVLELSNIAHAQARTLSVEQAKRLTIAVEMVANPAILFLDEPTSGLDARAALAVVQAIRNAANTGRTVVCTIHQPSMTIFESFDSLLLLKRGGRTIFFGELGAESRHLTDYLGAIPGAPRIRPGQNPAVYMLDVIGGGQSKGFLRTEPSEVWLRSDLRVEAMARLSSYVEPTEGSEALHVKGSPQVARELGILMRRTSLTYWRSPEYNVVRILCAGIFALIFGSVFWREDPDTFSAAFGRMGVLFMAAMFTGFLCFVSVLPIAGAERAVFYRERAAGMYSEGAFALSFFVLEIPYVAVLTALFCVVLHFSVGLRETGEAFGYLYGFHFFWFLFNATLGQMFTALMPNLTLAQGGGFGALQLIIAFAGFLKPAGDIGVLEFIYWLSPMHYFFEGVLVTQFKGDSTRVTVTDPETGQTASPTLFQFMSEDFSDGAFLYGHRHYDMAVLSTMCLSNFLLTWYVLRKVNHQTR